MAKSFPMSNCSMIEKLFLGLSGEKFTYSKLEYGREIFLGLKWLKDMPCQVTVQSGNIFWPKMAKNSAK